MQSNIAVAIYPLASSKCRAIFGRPGRRSLNIKSAKGNGGGAWTACPKNRRKSDKAGTAEEKAAGRLIYG